MLTIKNISSLKNVSNGTIHSDTVKVLSNEYMFTFKHLDYSGNFEIIIIRTRQSKSDSYDLELSNTTDGIWHRYTIAHYQMKDLNTFLEYINSLCHDWHIVNYK